MELKLSDYIKANQQLAYEAIEAQVDLDRFSRQVDEVVRQARVDQRVTRSSVTLEVVLEALQALVWAHDQQRKE